MASRKIIVQIDTEDDDLDVDEYIDAIKDACDDVEGRAHVAPETKITVGELING